MPRPDLSAEIGTPNACTGCHNDRPLQWTLNAYRRWYGEARKPHFGTTFSTARRGDRAAQPELVRLAGSELNAPIVRPTALELLARAPSPDGIAALRSATGSDEALLRRTAAANLPLRSADDVERLAPLLSDPLKAVRMATVSQLAAVPRDRLRPYQQDAFDAALSEYRESMAYELDFPSSNFNLGNLEYALGNVMAAEQYYRAALAVDELFSPAKANLAVLLSSQGRNKETEAMLREVVRDYPDDAGAIYSLDLLLVEMGRPGEALELLARAAEARANDARTHYNLGLLLQQVGRLDEARALTERMIKLYPDQPIGHQLKAAIDSAK